MSMTAVPTTLWAMRFVGIPYAEAGMTREGVNCWGLVRMVLADRAGIFLPSYGELSARQIGLVARGVLPLDQISDWIQVVRPAARALDVVLMTGSERLHCGIMVSAEHLLHVEAHCDTVMAQLESPRIAGRIRGVYRHRLLGLAA